MTFPFFALMPSPTDPFRATQPPSASYRHGGPILGFKRSPGDEPVRDSRHTRAAQQ